jgi:hypothetical protein
MKIGLEFEGVIRSSRDGTITRWPNIDERVRNNIKRMMFERREKIEPIDNYDCLVEVRTPPMKKPTPKKLIIALFTEMENATKAFRANGYFLQWSEQEIPEALHRTIQEALLHNMEHSKKETLCITGTGSSDWVKDDTNLFRGGGIHINVSPVPRIFSSALVMGLHNRLEEYKKPFGFKSHYRTNVLYRARWCESEAIAEYMSFGFNVARLEGWQDTLEILNTELKNGKYKYGRIPDTYAHMHWAWTLIQFLEKWFEEVAEYNALLPKKGIFDGLV